MHRLILHPFTNFIRTVRELLRDEAFRAAFATLVALVLVATVFYMLVEGWSPLDSLYFAVIAAATVGFGDLAPETSLGKVFTIIYVLTSVGLLVALLSRIAAGMVDRRIAERETEADVEEEPRRRRIRRRAAPAESDAADDGPADRP